MNNIHKAYLSLGSNTPDRLERMRAAMEFTATLGREVCASEIYETPALNGHDAAYLNAVVRVTTSLERSIVEIMAKNWEKRAGRRPEHKKLGAVCIDIDLVIWDDEILRPVDFHRNYFSRGYDQLIMAVAENPS